VSRLVDCPLVTSSPRAVLVTGGSRGIGRAIANAFAARGDRVAVHWGTSRDRAEAVLAELPGDGHVLVQADMTDAGAVGAMVDTAATALGGLDVLVNNAGVFVASPPLTSTYEEWQRVWARTLAVNLVGAANATFRAVPHMRSAASRTTRPTGRPRQG
jgi:NAD(P)-dependent dehydrogenase (short-subunit alcohol dehydrogenase family)